MAAKPCVVQLVGYSNSGKTTLLTKLIPLLEQAGVRVGVIKHDGGHDFEWDQPGKDTWRYREAGASLVAITSQTKTAIIEQRPTSLSVLVERLAQAGADLILVEGFKRESYPKLVLLRKPEDQELLDFVTHVRGIVSWGEVVEKDLPQFDVNDIDAIVSFIRASISK
ncbi:molybdopterin-guanine dinucleotide biosynthesis protein MobB [Brevibacillus reuszeri]|uniref:Molybdopterin-guanine dinucleotide biosynthesis protein MobB n=1 Tax=Brevibacillus reuszeri TaxID=54915 RepID=A0A0K9YX08_9BACL|nr:molybdopterin-guanine dinucleotide biosynthesis protein B [Brevibacillus reuszeri]KNB73177.1 molybdopterin-guanine dinucleotide biosynthesis protein MobB [Brevibacillus reuszeri]MED1856776.1 molybdopterin-guanine dinucleotide biosynthesis protein B [Brevibacillus reuszeri]GED68475.1 molybdopterin-guanine dinucleotide biosynthesis protein MobB [Brevibacillus reuszeri]